MWGWIGFTLGRMTRIIAGEFGGRKLAVPKVGTRPTTDRVREAIFSRLDHADALRGAQVLDLYAGSGALGLEALSRGAAEATFVESATPAVRVVEGNIKEFGLGTRAAVVRERVLPFLERTSKTFTLAFLDPPYDIAGGDLVAALAALAPRLDPGVPVVLEVSTRKRLPEWPRGLQVVQSKSYGETTVHFAERVR
jgi:16S rRNA (guanine966-N2)-methyltransferase